MASPARRTPHAHLVPFTGLRTPLPVNTMKASLGETSAGPVLDARMGPPPGLARHCSCALGSRGHPGSAGFGLCLSPALQDRWGFLQPWVLGPSLQPRCTRLAGTGTVTSGGHSATLHMHAGPWGMPGGTSWFSWGGAPEPRPPGGLLPNSGTVCGARPVCGGQLPWVSAYVPGGLAGLWGGRGPSQAGKGGPRASGTAAQALRSAEWRLCGFPAGEEPGSGSHCPRTMGLWGPLRAVAPAWWPRPRPQS